MTDSQNSGKNPGYQFDEVDDAVIAITGQLIVKVLESGLLSTAARETVFTIAKVFAELPGSTGDVYASLSLFGPRRNFGDHEITHYWSVEVEGEEIQVIAGGHFYRPSTGGDSFTSFRWVAIPGQQTACQDFTQSLRIVDDAKPFGTEVEELDLSKPGYSISVSLDGGEIIDEDEREDEETDDVELTSYELTLCLWAFLDADTKLIYALSGRMYCLSGDDRSKLKTLRELSRHDFRSVGKSRVPDRFKVVHMDGTETQGLVYPQTVHDPNAMLFEELMNGIAEQLPPLADFADGTTTSQEFPDDPLSVRTVVYEDAHGNCRAIVDEEDRAWLNQEMQ